MGRKAEEEWERPVLLDITSYNTSTLQTGLLLHGERLIQEERVRNKSKYLEEVSVR